MLLIESQILPPCSVLIQAVKSNGLMIEAFENYQKKSLRNKFYTASAAGKVYTTIPLVKGKANKLPIKEVKIAYDMDWSHDLSKKLKTNYSSSAYFDHYYEELMDIFSSTYERLFDLNTTLLEWLTNRANLSLDIAYTESYEKYYNQEIIDWRNKNLSFYLNHSSNKQLVYDQIFENEHGFISNLSTLDLLFNRGPETGYLISQSANSTN